MTSAVAAAAFPFPFPFTASAPPSEIDASVVSAAVFSDAGDVVPDVGAVAISCSPAGTTVAGATNDPPDVDSLATVNAADALAVVGLRERMASDQPEQTEAQWSHESGPRHRSTLVSSSGTCSALSIASNSFMVKRSCCMVDAGGSRGQRPGTTMGTSIGWRPSVSTGDIVASLVETRQLPCTTNRGMPRVNKGLSTTDCGAIGPQYSCLESRVDPSWSPPCNNRWNRDGWVGCK